MRPTSTSPPRSTWTRSGRPPSATTPGARRRTASRSPRTSSARWHSPCASIPSSTRFWNGDVVERWDALNIGVAIAVDDGLLAPALLDCAHRDVDDLAAGLADLTTRTRALRLKAAEMSEATFTLSNLGMFEVTQFTAIVTPPQVAILATGRAYERPVVRDSEVVVRRVMAATLSADHRVVDGAAAARFLGTLKSLIEAPAGWGAPGA